MLKSFREVLEAAREGGAKRLVTSFVDQAGH